MMKKSILNLFYRTERIRPGLHAGRVPALIALTAGLAVLSSSCALAAVKQVVLLRPAAGTPYQLYVPATGETLELAGTQNMNNAILEDVDGNGREDEIIYNDAVRGGLRYYRIPSDGSWQSNRDFAIPNTPKDAVPLTVVRTGTQGINRYVVYKSASLGRAYAILPSGSGLVNFGRMMDRAVGADVRRLGYRGDLVWWTRGVGIRWRAGITGTDSASPGSNWMLLGQGSVIPNQKERVILFHSSTGTSMIYACDRNWRYTALDGTAWSWTPYQGSTVVGDVNNDGVSELVLTPSASDPLYWYSVPNNGGPWSLSGLFSDSAIRYGWNLHGTGTVDIEIRSAVAVSNIDELRALPLGTLVKLAAKPRTKLIREIGASGSITVTGYYLGEPNQSGGIRVVGQTTAQEGQLVAVTGTLADANSERVIIASEQAVHTTVSKVSPLQTSIKALYGTAAATGLLVQLSGAISSGTAPGWFLLFDTTEQVSVWTYCPDANFPTGQVSVTACIGSETDKINTLPVLRVESSADIKAAATTPPPPPNPDPEPEPNPNVKFSAWSRSPMDKVFKTDLPTSARSASIGAARHEREVFQIALRSSSINMQSVTVKVNDFTSSSGQRIAASNVSVYVPRYVYLDYYKKEYPDPLPPYRGAFDIPINQTQPLWFELYVPKTAAAGTYSSTVTISTSNGGTVNFPVTLRVYGFTLPDDWKCATAFFLSYEELPAQEKVTLNSSAYFQLARQYYEFMVAKGVSPIHLPPDVSANILTTAANPYLTDPRVSAMLIPTTSNRTNQTNIINKFASLGVLHKGYFYPVDEPGTMAQIESVRTAAEYFHSINPKARVMVPFGDDPVDSSKPVWKSATSYTVGTVVQHHEQHGRYYKGYLYKCKVAHTSSSTTEPNKGSNWKAYWSKETAISTMTGYCDVFCPIADFFDEWHPELEQRRQAGDTIWSYVCLDAGSPRPNYHIERLPIETRIMTWLNYRYRATGLLYWRVNDWRNTVPNPYEDPAAAYGLYGEGVLLYPGNPIGVSGPVSSIRFEMLREALEDYQYLWLLEQKIGRTGVMNYVNQLTTNWQSYSKNGAQMESIRDQIARAIEN